MKEVLFPSDHILEEKERKRGLLLLGRSQKGTKSQKPKAWAEMREKHKKGILDRCAASTEGRGEKERETFPPYSWGKHTNRSKRGGTYSRVNSMLQERRKKGEREWE